MSSALDRFMALFDTLQAGRMGLLDEVYSPDVVFEDPLHRVVGLAALKAYFDRLYEGVAEIRFEFGDVVAGDGRAMLSWTMHMRHGRLRPQETLALPGASAVRHGELVHYHRDYFDLGAMIYERVPVLGGLVRAVKATL